MSKIDDVIEKTTQAATSLDKLIAQTAHTLDCLIALRNIQNSGDCNECANRGCLYRPEAGQMTRYNCPLFMKKAEAEE
jgi:hypothetical protein